MNELRPLLDEGATDLEAALLREAAAEQPSPAALERTLRTLGVTGVVIAAGAATGASAIKTSLLSILIKWLGTLSLIGIFAGAMIHWRGPLFGWMGHPNPSPTVGENATAAIAASASDSTPTLSASTVPASTVPASTVPASTVPASTVPASTVPSDDAPLASEIAPSASAESPDPSADPVASGDPTPHPDRSAHASSEPSTRSLAPEIALIDQARAALHGGKPALALTLLDTYRRQFAGGRLAPEANYLRIEALVATGDRKSAESLARKSMGSGAQSPHDKRIRSILENGTTSPAP